jgi:septum formation protein
MVLTLASRSPRRRELLAQLGIPLAVLPAETDETPAAGEPPRDYVLRVAREKAAAVTGETVLGADTSVVLDGAILGKPRDDAEARQMLRSLSGRSHQVLTGVCVRRRAREEVAVATTTVRLAPLSDGLIAWYVRSGEPFDKAGAYAVQGLAGAFVTEVEGSISNVVGLPLAETLALLARLGFPLPWDGEGRR